MKSDVQVLLNKLVNEHAPVTDAVTDSERSTMLQRLGMSASELSRTVGVPESVIRSYVNEGKNPGAIFAPVLAKTARLASKMAVQREA